MPVVTNWDVACPHCGAGVNQPCDKPRGQATVKFHAARIRAAQRAREAPTTNRGTP